MLTSPLPFKATKTRDDAEDSERSDQKRRQRVAIKAINLSANRSSKNQPPVPDR
jgi:hypothetical protein